VEILRRAFKSTMEDPAFLADLKKANLPSVYVSPEQVEKSVERIHSISPQVKKNLRFLVKGRERK
jgi:tripartite-type tricarboxylate transporter receptor subunit TctC